MSLLRTFAAILREIFEESAYERYCARERIEPSREAYASFLRELDATRGTKVRCC